MTVFVQAMLWAGFLINHSVLSFFSLPLEIHIRPIIIDNILHHQGIVKRKYAKLAIACLPSELIVPGGSGV